MRSQLVLWPILLKPTMQPEARKLITFWSNGIWQTAMTHWRKIFVWAVCPLWEHCHAWCWRLAWRKWFTCWSNSRWNWEQISHRWRTSGRSPVEMRLRRSVMWWPPSDLTTKVVWQCWMRFSLVYWKRYLNTPLMTVETLVPGCEKLQWMVGSRSDRWFVVKMRLYIVFLALYTLVTTCPSELLQPESVQEIMIGFAQQAVEIIDRTRGLAGSLFCKLVYQ